MALFWGKEDAPAIRRPSDTIRRGACHAFVWSTGDALRDSAEHVSFGSEADVERVAANVSFGPDADIDSAAANVSFGQRGTQGMAKASEIVAQLSGNRPIQKANSASRRAFREAHGQLKP